MYVLFHPEARLSLVVPLVLLLPCPGATLSAFPCMVGTYATALYVPVEFLVYFLHHVKPTSICGIALLQRNPPALSCMMA